MRALVLILAAAVAGLGVRSVHHRARLQRLDLVTGAFRTAEPDRDDPAPALACSEPGPSLGAGMLRFRCSRPAGHEGVHVAQLPNGQTVDSWAPRRMAA